MHLQTLLIVFLLSFACGQDRKISSELNPGCKNCGTDITLVYIRANGSHDTVHQLWDFTRGTPTVIYAITDLDTALNITWNKEKPVKFEFTDKLLYSFAATIDKLQEFNDIENNGHIDNKCPQRALPLRYVQWQRTETLLSNGTEAMLHMRGYFEDERQRGVIDMKLDFLPFKDYAVNLPHLIHTANSTLMDVSLINLTSSSDYNASRFAIHFTMVSTDASSDTMTCDIRKSLDDEHTPGVFEIFEVKTPRSSRSGDGGFMQFRPVCYTEPERSVSSSTNAYISSFTNATRLSGTLADFYRDYDRNNLLVQDMFISFGLPGDGFYRQYNYTSWSYTLGYGIPPEENVSLFVIIIISIGLGVPVLLALSGITYVLVRRCRQRNTPTRFTDDD